MLAFAHPGFSSGRIRFEVCDVDFRVFRSTLKMSSRVASPESVHKRTTIDDGETGGLWAAQNTHNKLTMIIVIGRITVELTRRATTTLGPVVDDKPAGSARVQRIVGARLSGNTHVRCSLTMKSRKSCSAERCCLSSSHLVKIKTRAPQRWASAARTNHRQRQALHERHAICASAACHCYDASAGWNH